MQIRIFAAATAASVLALSTHASAQTTIEWWHAMGGELGVATEAVATAFNESQSDYVVVPTYRGTYTETLTGAIAAFRAGEQPNIVQVFEVGTGTMMAAEGAIVPVYELMERTGAPFDPSAFLPAVVGYYTDPEGNMLSMPFNSSTPILYYNKNVFEAAGLDPEQPPRTWSEVESFSRQIMESGAAECGFTTGWVSWVQLENFSAWHNQPIGTLQNGFGGLETEMTVNGPVQVRHWENLARWEDEGLFRYGGPGGGNDAPPAFYAQECAIYMNSSASRAGVIANTPDFEVGYGMLPYYEDVDGAPQNSIIGGATLWVLSGGTPEEEAGVAAFFNFISSPEVQARWHQETGYLPITQAAYDLSTEQGYYEANPGADVSILQMTMNEPTDNSRGLRFGNYVQIRTVIDEEFQRLLAGDVDAQGALDAVVERGNALIRDFEAAN
ncbi:sn-glycerol-3-phosphate ABC transporter substrate-binding protein UgpB [Roseicyclus sp.]|uniref:sn-glycerol-3-phosphate ABC transporter substrate-binding protein UgpB n=1 Tax=Roseicyclus sp. TaxID=1914329 RepID=UPI003F9F6072